MARHEAIINPADKSGQTWLAVFDGKIVRGVEWNSRGAAEAHLSGLKRKHQRMFDFKRGPTILTTVIAVSIDEAWEKVENQDRLGIFPRDDHHTGPLVPYMHELEREGLLEICESPLSTGS